MAKASTKKYSAVREVYEWVETFLVALAAVIFIFTFVVKFVTVDGTSMLQTFNSRDRLIISNIGYTPRQGDVVVVDVSHNSETLGYSAAAPYIKRVIATEEQVVNIDPFTWTVYVDGKPIEEPYVYHCDDRPMNMGFLRYPYTVPKGCVFVMGDNRNGSSDSRMLGAIENKYILGKAFLRLTPKFGVIK